MSDTLAVVGSKCDRCGNRWGCKSADYGDGHGAVLSHYCGAYEVHARQYGYTKAMSYSDASITNKWSK